MNSQTVFITGASSGIGEACAIKFAQQGYNLILNARRTDKLETLKQELEAQYKSQILLLPFDVRDTDAAIEQIAALPAEFSHIDVLINNAGLALGTDKEHEGNLTDYITMIDTNIKGLLTITKCVVPLMVAQGYGHVINIGSIAGDAAYPGGSVYCATKAAVKALTDGLRMDLYDTPIRVSNIKPGLVETNFSNVRYHGDTAAAKKLYTGIKPLTGADIAEVIYFTASAPAHVQIAEVEILATHQATAQRVFRD